MTTQTDNSVTLNLSLAELQAIRQALHVRSQTVIGACVDEQTLSTLEARVEAAIMHVEDETGARKPSMSHWTFTRS
jgi:hypothetical protein